MEAEGTADAGAGSTLMGGSVTPPEDGSADNPQDGSTVSAAPAETASTLPEWMSGFEVDSDLAGDPSLKAIKDVPTLIKSYVHAQRKMGADKAVLPNKNSTNEEWMQLYHKLGLPTDFGEYSVNAEENAIGEEFTEAFRKTAYDNKLLPEQANALFDFVNTQVREENQRIQQGQEDDLSQGINNLREEWGEAFDQNVFKAKAAVKEFGGEDFQKYLNDSGLGNNPELIKIFSKIGSEFMKEDNFEGSARPAYAMSPSDAQAKINQITGDFAGPYYNSAHPDHKRIVDEVAKLYEVMARK